MSRTFEQGALSHYELFKISACPFPILFLKAMSPLHRTSLKRMSVRQQMCFEVCMLHSLWVRMRSHFF